MNVILRTRHDEGIPSLVSIMEDGDKIVATMGVYLQPHLDGFWIDPAYRGKADYRRMWKPIEEFLKDKHGLRLYASPTFGNGERMTELLGFGKPEIPVMVREF